MNVTSVVKPFPASIDWKSATEMQSHLPMMNKKVLSIAAPIIETDLEKTPPWMSPALDQFLM